MAAILDFQVANRVDFISVPMGLTVPNLVLVSQFAQFCHNIDVIRSTTVLATGHSLKMTSSNPLCLPENLLSKHTPL